MSNELKRFHVSLHEEQGDKFRVIFQCLAEDAEHAQDLAQDEFPGGEILLAREVSEVEWFPQGTKDLQLMMEITGKRPGQAGGETETADAEPGMQVGWKAVRKVLQGLRDSGHAVVVFTPEELKDTSPQRLSDHMISRGWDFIECSSGSSAVEGD